MDGINAYSKPSADGKSVVVDVETMLVDLITIWKASGKTKAELLAWTDEVFDQVEVGVYMPKSHKN